jgi:hypothetical protein
MIAKRNMWKTNPFPETFESFQLDRTYNVSKFEKLIEGIVPEEMEDKWFVFYEEPWLFLHHSWSGDGEFKVRFESADGGRRVAEVLAARDAKQRSSNDIRQDQLLMAALLDGFAGRNSMGAWFEFQDYLIAKRRGTLPPQ